MKKTLLSIFTLLFLNSSFSQDTLYYENFESGNSFTLNTNDLSGATAGTNLWVMNNVYSGGYVTLASCFSLSTTISTSTSQPAGVVNGPTSNYLHITSSEGINNGVTNAHFIASDGGALCYSDESNFSKMTNDISTTGKSDVSFSFYWMCGGAAGTNFGEVYYSTDGGTSWNLTSTPMSSYVGQTTWTQTTITDANFDNQTTLRFGVRFVNNNTSSAVDPSFAIDELVVSAPQSISITENYDDHVCENEMVDIDYTSSGITFNPGNVFTLEMSDNTGSFTTPLTITTLNSTNTSGTISGMLPLSTNGSGYLYRINSSDPAITGAPSLASLDINPSVDTNVTVTISGVTNTATAVATGVNYQWYNCDNMTNEPGANNQSYTPTLSANYAVIITDNDNVCKDTSFCHELIIGSSSSISEENETTFSIYPNPAKEIINIKTIHKVNNINIVNVFGQTVLSENSKVIDLSHLANGVYFIKVKINDQLYTKRLIKN